MHELPQAPRGRNADGADVRVPQRFWRPGPGTHLSSICRSHDRVETACATALHKRADEPDFLAPSVWTRVQRCKATQLRRSRPPAGFATARERGYPREAVSESQH
eukprot:5209706-Prymnesium_polylepis.1